ncbi:DUF5686 and carboxypeptidase regulatory-like domain-containing protein [Flavihumibacter solisilvae]|uniref:Carboxypeptidase-like regulatory domain-containing protein n=1 Tax=Flavihumibacter solisilvae TaxID=1349421 RepID=A0A0C1IX73_9BACT|nr:DUF5686 and carboxypeptidase regulatory-like domain-containing protein [Flavihumibacter solisilvae]KIC95029.1 hypothetical protein OI18_09110 [Flavihumibacter solisilvae]
MRLRIIVILLFFCSGVSAAVIKGYVKDANGKPLAYASVYVKNGRQGTTAGVNGYYQLSLTPGRYTIIAQHVGYAKMEREVEVGDQELSVDFTLTIQQVSLNEVVVRAGAEDPAYAIIRNAIKKRKEHLEELSHFSCEVYTKEQFQLRDYPKKFMGQKVDFEDGDTSKRKMLYLSETVARYSVKPPDKSKVEVLSTRVSGNANAFGLTLPKIVNFYENYIVAEGLNPRGFISPIAANALNYYRYKFEGSFMEDSVEVNRIKVIPKRKYEPLFSGYIMITENSWRIHSLQLELYKTSQMEILDTLRMEQLYAPLNGHAWVIRNQVLYPTVRLFGFDAFGSSVTVYSKFDLEADFTPKYFNNTLMKYNEGSNKKPSDYWDSIRPLPLQPEEISDYHKKDSLEQVRKDPKYLDSLDRVRNKIGIGGILFTGETISKQKRRSVYNIDPLIRSVSFNTVEGWVANLSGSWVKRFDSTNFQKQFVLRPNVRYGFSNGHLNGRLQAHYQSGGRHQESIGLSGGKYVFQYNNANPVGSFMNSFSTLLRELNHMKLYEAWYARADYSRQLGSGLDFTAAIQYQDRRPLSNSSDLVWRNVKERTYTPNYPTDIMSAPMDPHQALLVSAGLSWQPGMKYIEFPDRRMSLGSKYPVVSARLTKGVKDLFSSDVDYLKWEMGVKDDLQLRLAGMLQYSFSAGGFLQSDAVQVPDYKHFMGNRLILANGYSNSFQALHYYRYSNTEKIWAEGHLEHHFNGVFTNKIPGFRKLNWYLVGGANALWLDGNKHYSELYLGLENIFKLLRTDIVWSFDQGSFSGAYFRFSIRGITGGGD